MREYTGISDGNSAVNYILEGFRTLLVKERQLLKASADVDEGTNALISDHIREQEKSVRMYSSFSLPEVRVYFFVAETCARMA